MTNIELNSPYHYMLDNELDIGYLASALRVIHTKDDENSPFEIQMHNIYVDTKIRTKMLRYLVEGIYIESEICQ